MPRSDTGSPSLKGAGAGGGELWTSFEVAQWAGGPAGVLCERVLQGLENSWVLRVETLLHHPVTPPSDKVQPPLATPKPLSLKDLWRDLLLELFLKRMSGWGFLMSMPSPGRC